MAGNKAKTQEGQANSEDKPKHPGGRPTLYKDEYVDQAYKLCLLGATDEELAGFFEVNEDTIYEWKNKHEEFSDSIKKAKLIADATIANRLFERAKGCVINVQQAIKLTTKELKGDKLEQHEHVEVVDLLQEVPPDTTAAIFWLKNRQPSKWRDKVQTELSGEIGVKQITGMRIE